MSLAQELPKDVQEWCLQTCPICGRDNYMMIQGTIDIQGVEQKYPDIGYSFCNCNNVFYTTLNNPRNPIEELQESFDNLNDEEAVTLVVPDSFFINLDDPYQFKLWKPREHNFIWDIDSLCEIIRDVGYEVVIRNRQFDVGSLVPQTSILLIRKPFKSELLPSKEFRKPSKEEINVYEHRFNCMLDNLNTVRQYLLMYGQPGNDHYRLWFWLAHQFNNIRISEIGTMDGCGALALAVNPNNEVYTYDIAIYPETITYPSNAHSVLVTPDYMDDVCKSKIIVYDAAHAGPEEQAFYNELVKRNWKGLLLLDDIYLNEPMKEFWEGITKRKEDWTDIGHSCGTGAVFFE